MQKISILLACVSGMSTSMMVQKMKEAASQREIEVFIDAVSTAEALESTGDYDVLLLGPQVAYMENEFKSKVSIPVGVIPMMMYGTMNGEGALDYAVTIKEGK